VLSPEKLRGQDLTPASAPAVLITGPVGAPVEGWKGPTKSGAVGSPL